MPDLQPQRDRQPMWARLRDQRPGIAWQLGIAFIGVAALAAVANFAVQRTITVTTTRMAAAQAAAVERDTLSPRWPASPRAAQPAADGVAALPALERLTAAVTGARLERSALRHERARAAAGEVRDTLQRLHGDAARSDALLHTGRQIIDVEAARDTAYREYVDSLARVEQRLQDAFDQAWKIFGRVVARQPLVVADQRIEELRRHAERLRDDRYTADDLVLLESLEAQFGLALNEGQRMFVRSQGAEWFAATSADFGQLHALRERIVQQDVRRRELLPRFEAGQELVRAQLRRPASQRAADEVVARDASGRPLALTQRPLVVTPRWELPLPVARTEQLGGVAPAGLAWLSISVLVLLLAVSMLTVLSILRPVQRLIGATQRIALGETGVRVAQGGSRELDSLATAFNRMAAELESAQSVARNYQQQLEARVAERTRQLQHQAGHDALTQLPNRRQLFDQLRTVLARAAGRRGRAAVFFIDLDHFKNINDGRGHGFGDRVLVAIARRLSDTVGPRGAAARFGGDEFTVVVEADDDHAALVEMGKSLVHAFQRPLMLEGRELLVSVSVGAAFYPEHGADAEALLRAADAALFEAKAQGRGQLALFTPALLEAASARFTTEQGLRQAVERGEFELVFQPEIDIARCEVAVCEALLRWRRPDGTLASPDQFLSVAEDSGLIVEINDWVLRAAIAAAARWRTNGHPHLRVAINASSRQLADPAFAGRVGALLMEHGLSPAALEIELTETVLQTGAGTIEGLGRLRQMGISVALDDFGTGYSSLASLEQLPLDRVKLDRSLVARIDCSARAASIASAIINLCRDLGVAITAEGVERPEQLAALRDSGITLQGFLLSRPVPESRLAEAVRQLPALLQSLLLRAPVRPGAAVVQQIRPRTRPRRHLL